MNATKNPKEPDKACKIKSEPTNADKEEFLEFVHHIGAASHYCQGRMPNYKDLGKELSRPFLVQLHHADMSGERIKIPC